MNPLLSAMDRIVYVAGGQAASGTTEEVVRPEVLSAPLRSPRRRAPRPRSGRRRGRGEAGAEVPVLLHGRWSRPRASSVRPSAVRRHERLLVLARRARLLLDPTVRVGRCSPAGSWRSPRASSASSPSCAASPSPARRSATSARRGFGGLPRLDQPALGLRRSGARRGRSHRGDRDPPRAQSRDLATGHRARRGARVRGALSVLRHDSLEHDRCLDHRALRLALRDRHLDRPSDRRAERGGARRVCSFSTGLCFSDAQSRPCPGPWRARSVSSAPATSSRWRSPSPSPHSRSARCRDGVAHRPTGHRTPARETTRARRARSRGDRGPGDLARHPPCLRQLLLAAGGAWLAGQLPHRRARVRLLPPCVRSHRCVRRRA